MFFKYYCCKQTQKDEKLFLFFIRFKVLFCFYAVFQEINGTSLYDFACVFWDYKLNDWSTAGCYKGNASDGVLRCFCEHTTNFAALWVQNTVQKHTLEQKSSIDKINIRL